MLTRLNVCIECRHRHPTQGLNWSMGGNLRLEVSNIVGWEFDTLGK